MAHVHKAQNAEENKDERDKPKLPSFSTHPRHQNLLQSHETKIPLFLLSFKSETVTPLLVFLYAKSCIGFSFMFELSLRPSPWELRRASTLAEVHSYVLLLFYTISN